jgi:hypothetical protein
LNLSSPWGMASMWLFPTRTASYNKRGCAMNYENRLAVALVAFAALVRAEDVNLSGTVTNESDEPVEKAIVQVLGEGLQAQTDASGHYAIQQLATTLRRSGHAGRLHVAIGRGRATLSLPSPQPVSIDVFNTRGRLIDAAVDEVLAAGRHEVGLFDAPVAEGLFTVRVRAGGETHVFRHLSFNSVRGEMWATDVTPRTLRKTAAVVDTLRVSKTGYTTKSLPLESLTGTVDVALEPEKKESSELPTPTRVVNVSNDSQLQNAVAGALPGDHIVLADGTYTQQVHVYKKATAAEPIVIRAKDVLGAHLAGGFWLDSASRHIWIYGVDLKDAKSRLEGRNHVIRRVRIWPPFVPDGDSKGVRTAYGKNARIDYSELRLYTTDEVQSQYGRVWGDASYGDVQHYWHETDKDWFDSLIIERCLLTGGPHDVAYAQPNSQFIETSGHDQSGETHDVHWIVRDVYGDVTRDRTLIDFKYRSVHLERVHIKSPGGAVQVRSACCHSIKECRFEGAYIAINAQNNTVENTVANRFLVLAGDLAWDDFSNFGAHRQAYNTKLYNTSGTLNIGYQYSDVYTFPAVNTLSEGHEGTINYGLEQNTTVRATSSKAKKTPVTLNATVVGPFAPWVGVE